MTQPDELERWVADGVAAAGSLLETDGAGSWRATVVDGTGGGTFSSVVVRLSRSDRSAVVKLVHRNDVSPEHPRSWRRELDLYRSDWLRSRLPRGVRIPRCLASTVFLTQVHLVADAISEVAPAVAGRPLDEVLAAWRAVADHLIPPAEQSLDALGA